MFLKKLFFGGGPPKPTASSTSSTSSSPRAVPKTPAIEFGDDEVNLIVFQESDRQSGVLFDSRSKRTNQIENRLLYEMVFGTVPLSREGLTTKLHVVSRTRQILVTKVFRVTFVSSQQQEQDVLSPVMSFSSISSSASSFASSLAFSTSSLDAQRSWKRTFAVVLLFDDVVPIATSELSSSSATMLLGISGSAASTNVAAGVAAGAGSNPLSQSVGGGGLLPHQLCAKGAGSDDERRRLAERRRNFVESHFALIDHQFNVYCRELVINLRRRFARISLLVMPAFERHVQRNNERCLFSDSKSSCTVVFDDGAYELSVPGAWLATTFGESGFATAIVVRREF